MNSTENKHKQVSVDKLLAQQAMIRTE